MIYFLFLLIGLGAVAYVGAPFRKRKAAHEYSSEAPRDGEDGRTLGERRDNLLRQLKELEFDRSMGKTEGEEYSLLREELSQEAAVVLQQLEAHEPASREPASRKFSPDAVPSDSSLSAHVAEPEADEHDGFNNGARFLSVNYDIELDIEAEVLVARAKRKRCAANGIAPKAAAQANMTREAETAFCTACGHRMNPDDRFCARCGQRRAIVSSTVVASATVASGSAT